MPFESVEILQFAAGSYPRSAPRTGLMVLFPGFGYGPDKPLLHYARKSALAAGWQTLAIDYGPLSRTPGDSVFEASRAAFPQAFSAACAQVDSALRAGEYARILFVSKSFGTLIAGELTASRPAIGAENFFLTPLGDTLPYLGQPGCMAATGGADGLVTAPQRRAMRELLGSRLLLFPGADHSLEVAGDPLAGIEILSQVTAALCRMLGIPIGARGC
ncbi:MAG TPA: hypothetical protein H9896_05340 [Candidatus Pygmaiobacter gallistercoris]|nr:hypothetical protein [Candidatus Pygmaiobacter gallistercoris]